MPSAWHTKAAEDTIVAIIMFFMIHLALLLITSRNSNRNWHFLFLFGLFLMLVGATVLVDLVDGSLSFGIVGLGWVLSAEGVVAIAYSMRTNWANGITYFATGFVSLIVGSVIICMPLVAELVIEILFGASFVANGLLRIPTAWIIRFPGWKKDLAIGLAYTGMGVFLLCYENFSEKIVIPAMLGLAQLGWGYSLARSSLRLRSSGEIGQDPREAKKWYKTFWGTFSIPRFARNYDGGILRIPPDFIFRKGKPRGRAEAAERTGALRVHIWTPKDSADGAQHVAVVSRYIAAVDRHGRVSTGHAALELKPDIYISHYPKDEIERAAGGGLADALRSQDIPGRFLPSLESEVAGWMPPTVSIEFTRFDAEQLRVFWAIYRENATYNLTNRNCAVTVAQALDAALTGALSEKNLLWTFVRLLLKRDLWVAGFLRQRATLMVWTPGLLLDYAMRMRNLVDHFEREVPV